VHEVIHLIIFLIAAVMLLFFIFILFQIMLARISMILGKNIIEKTVVLGGIT